MLENGLPLRMHANEATFVLTGLQSHSRRRRPTAEWVGAVPLAPRTLRQFMRRYPIPTALPGLHANESTPGPSAPTPFLKPSSPISLFLISIAGNSHDWLCPSQPPACVFGPTWILFYFHPSEWHGNHLTPKDCGFAGPICFSSKHPILSPKLPTHFLASLPCLKDIYPTLQFRTSVFICLHLQVKRKHTKPSTTPAIPLHAAKSMGCRTIMVMRYNTHDASLS